MPRTTPGSGALLRPFFNSNYGVHRIDVVDGGAGYAKTDPPKVIVEGTSTPTVEGVFYPIIKQDNLGISTIASIMVFKPGAGYYPVFSTSSSSQVVVERASFGSTATSHTVGAAYSVYTGDYNVVDDNIFFTDAPYGKTGPVGLLTGSSFAGRLFSRKMDPYDQKDKNVILDDIALEFTGIAGTQFNLSENLGVVTALYNDVNTGVDVNNNPFILINNVVQTPGKDFEVIDSDANKINFLSGVPRAGKITKVGLQTGSGYYMPLKASARVGVGSTGTLEFVAITGKGQGYRSVPEINVRSSQGTGAALTAHLGTSAGSAVAISTAIYNHLTGIATFNTGANSHGFDVDDRIRITGAGFTFTPTAALRNINTFGYDYVTGIATIGVTGGHYIGTGTNASKSLLVKQVQVYNGISTYTFREDAYPIVEVIDNLNVLVSCGISTQPLTYVSGGLVRSGVDTAILDGKNITGFDVLGVTTNTFEVFAGIATFSHQYVTGGVVNRAEAGIITSFSISDAGSGYYYPRNVSYINGTPSNGITTFTAYGNRVFDTHIYNAGVSADAITITQGSVNKDVSGATYDPETGDLTLAIGSHSYTTSNTLKINTGKLSFTCSKDNHQTTHAYPRTSDPVYNKTDVAITSVGATTLTVNVGEAGGVDIASLTYDDVTGIATITPFHPHGLNANSVVKLTGIAFSTGIGDITFPSDVQRYYAVTGFAGTAFTVNIGAAMTTTGIHTAQSGIGSFIHYEGHGLNTDDFVQVTGIAVTFASAPAVQVGGVSYDQRSGIATITTRKKHNLKEDDCVILSGIALTCEYEPALGVSSALYDNTTGVMTVTTAANHGYKVGKDIILTGLGFTCQLDNGANQHYYPRSRSTAFDTSIEVVGTAGTTVTVDVGFAPVQDQFTHTFDKAIANALITGGEYGHKFVKAEDGALLTGGDFAHKFISATSDSTFSGGNYEHKFVNASSKSINVGGNYAHTFVSSRTIPNCISVTGGGTKTPTHADYNPSTGDLVLTVNGHGLNSPTVHTITTSRYNALVGIMTITVPSHGFSNGEQIKINDNSIGFKCSMDGFSSTHTYPRTTDPVSNQWLPISNKTNDTFEVFVGMSTIVNYNVTDAQYTPSVGVMTMTIGNHDLLSGTSIKFKPLSLGFQCEMDGKTATKYYPRTTDPVYDTAVPITGVGDTTITVQVGVSTLVPWNVVYADYNPVAGIMTVSLDRVHTMIAGDSIKFKGESIAFKCSLDGYQSNHYYPRPTDPVYDTAVPIVSAAGTIFTVDVGQTSSGNYIHSFLPNQGVAAGAVISGGDYPHTFSGIGTDAVITGGAYDHTFETANTGGLLKVAQTVGISSGALTFKCAKDNYATEHAYPRKTDPIFGSTTVGITTTTTDTFTVRVGVSTIEERATTNATYNPSTGDVVLTVGSGHTYTSQTSHTITTAIYNPSGGVLELTIPNHEFLSGEYIKFNDGAITFTCDEDQHATNHAYPRPSDPYSNRWLSIYNVGVNTFSVFVGISTNTTSHTFVSAVSNGLKKATDTIGINTAALTFTCARDAHETNHSYPRSTDPIGGLKSVGIGATTDTTITFNVGVSTIVNHSISTASYTAQTGLLTIESPNHGFNGATTTTITGAKYNASVGIMTVTVPSHGFTNGDRVRIAPNSIKFRCYLDNRKTIHSYPRRTDPTTSQWLAIDNATTDTFEVNVGTSPIVNYTPSAGSYDPVTGLMVVTIGNHKLRKGTSVKLKTRAFKFTCAKDNHATNHFYPRATAIGGPDPAYNTAVEIVSASDTTITLDVGKSSNQSEHIFVSASADSVITGGDYVHTYEFADIDGLMKANDTLGITTNSFTFTCDQDNHATNHTYPRAGYGHTFVSATAGAAFTGGSYAHNFVSAGTDSIYVTQSGAKLTPTNAAYNAETGNMVLTFGSNHGLVAGTNTVGIATNSITLTCERDNHATEHTYPRSTDPVHGLTNVAIGATTLDTITVNVGVSQIVSKNITAATYDPEEGSMVITIANHGLLVGQPIGIVTNSMTWTCARDSHLSQHTYPRLTDPIHNKNVSIGATTANTITLVVGKSNTGDPINDQEIGIITSTTDTFTLNVGITTQVKYNITTSTYTASTGIVTVSTDTAHGLTTATAVGLATGGLTFTCAMDQHGSEHAYPRPGFAHTFVSATSGAVISGGDYAHTYVSSLAGVAFTGGDYKHNFVSAGTNCVTVGSWSGSRKTPTDASYNPTTGNLILTFGSAHGLIAGTNTIGIETGGIVMTCARDSHATNHAYPRSQDPIHTLTNVAIAATTVDTLTVNVGVSTIVSSGITTATYTPSTGDIELTVGSGHGLLAQSQATATNANYNPAAGIMTVTVAGHGWVVGEYVKFEPDAFVFTCGIDTHATNHAYPRPSDDYYNTWLPILGADTNTFSVQVVKNPPSTSVGVHTFVSSATNGIKKATDTIGIHTRSITMTCARDAHGSNHAYPRDADPINNKQIGIKAVTSTTITVNCGISTLVTTNVSGASYNDVNGELELTVGSGHGFVVNDNANVGIQTNALTFTCAMDNHASNHTYPRTTDPIHNKIVSIGSTSDTTITLNCGAAGIDDPAHKTGLYPIGVTGNTVTLNVGVTTQVNFNVDGATYQESVGVMTMSIGTHSLEIGQTVKLANESLYFKCSRDGNATSHVYPKGGDPWYNGSKISRVISNTQIETNVGISTVPTFYNAGGTVQGCIIAPREFNNSSSGSDYASGGTFVDKVLSDTQYVVNVGISTVDHLYNRGGLSAQGKRVAASAEEGFSGFDVIERLDNASFRVNAGLTTEISLFKRGGRLDKPIFVDIQEPDPYFNRKLEFISGTSGIGTNAVVNVRVNVDGNIGEFDLIEEGTAYQVADKLTFSGISSDPRVGVLTEFQLEVEELENDKFSGFYPGQFILFDDISTYFNGTRKKFTLSVTTGGNTEILSLKTLPGSDMDITNNIFIYINDILQTPQSSYTFKGSRIIFTEAPKPNSKCSVFYFRGSKRDVETVEPPLSVKAGDTVQIKENKLNDFDIDQFARTGKRIVASDVLETFTYDSVGIDTDQSAERPLTWEKQRQDRILSGVLISKARPSLRSKVLPTTRIIKTVGELDDKIYVNNAYPNFTGIDLLTQAERNILVYEDNEIAPGIVTSYVSTSSSISSLNISYGGTGYANLSSPTIVISNAQIQRKDPIKEWKFDALTGVTDSVTWNALTPEEPIVAVGSSSRYINTKSGTFWERGNIGYGGTITFNGIGVGYTYGGPNVYVMAVGEYAKLSRSVSMGNSMGSWTEIDLMEERQIPAINVTTEYDSTYRGNLQDIVWEGTRNSWVTVGSAGSVFTGIGITATKLYSQYSTTIQQLNAVTYGQSEFIAVGNGGVIIASNDGRGWSPKVSNTNYDLNDIIYDGNRFIAVGDNGTIGISSDKNYWQPWSQQLPAGTVHPATFDFGTIEYVNNLYIGLSTGGDMYYSFDLANWNARPTGQSEPVNAIVNTTFGDSRGQRIIAVGGATTAFYADPVINRASATASVTAGVITAVTVTDGGFGYDVGSSPPVILETDRTKKEEILSIRSKGDFGDIVGVNTWLPGSGSKLPTLEFTLKSQYNDNTNLGYGYSSLNQLGVEYSGLQKDDYFVIYDSPLVVGHALTGITTSTGSNVQVGMVTSGDYLGGLFRVEKVTDGDSISGLVTVTCAFEPGPVTMGNNQIHVGVGTTATIDTFWGKYSWGQIYGYQNRGAGTPTPFFVNSDNGNVGLSTAAVVSRIKPLT